jgi:hypothetical protein
MTKARTQAKWAENKRAYRASIAIPEIKPKPLTEEEKRQKKRAQQQARRQQARPRGMSSNANTGMSSNANTTPLQQQQQQQLLQSPPTMRPVQSPPLSALGTTGDFLSRILLYTCLTTYPLLRSPMESQSLSLMGSPET